MKDLHRVKLIIVGVFQQAGSFSEMEKCALEC